MIFVGTSLLVPTVPLLLGKDGWRTEGNRRGKCTRHGSARSPAHYAKPPYGPLQIAETFYFTFAGKETTTHPLAQGRTLAVVATYFPLSEWLENLQVSTSGTFLGTMKRRAAWAGDSAIPRDRLNSEVHQQLSLAWLLLLGEGRVGNRQNNAWSADLSPPVQ